MENGDEWVRNCQKIEGKKHEFGNKMPHNTDSKEGVRDLFSKKWLAGDFDSDYSDTLSIDKVVDFWLAEIAARDERLVEIFQWLLGELGDFPDLSTKPHYRFRSELREKLKTVGLITSHKED